MPRLSHDQIQARFDALHASRTDFDSDSRTEVWPFNRYVDGTFYRWELVSVVKPGQNEHVGYAHTLAEIEQRYLA